MYIVLPETIIITYWYYDINNYYAFHMLKKIFFVKPILYTVKTGVYIQKKTRSPCVKDQRLPWQHNTLGRGFNGVYVHPVLTV